MAAEREVEAAQGALYLRWVLMPGHGSQQESRDCHWLGSSHCTEPRSGVGGQKEALSAVDLKALPGKEELHTVLICTQRWMW